MSKELGEKLKFLRNKTGFTQEDIGKHLSVDRSTYSNYERAVTEPDIETLKKLAKIFAVDFNYLLSSERVHKVADINGIATDDLAKLEKTLIVRFRLLSDEQKKKALDFMGDFLVVDKKE